MVDTYRGESPSKKLTRLEFWNYVKTQLTDEQFIRGKKLVLASREAGDVSLLLGSGCDPKSIIAVDREESAVQAVRERFPNVPVFHGDVVDVARKHRHELVIAHLDLCSPLSRRSANLVLKSMLHGLRDRTLIGAAFMYGREGESTRDELSRERQEIQQLTEDLRQQQGIFTPGIREGLIRNYLPRVANELFADNDFLPATEGSGKAAENVIVRICYLTELLEEMGEPHFCVPYSLRTWFYKSHGKGSTGSPMLYWLGRVHRPYTKNVKKFNEKLNALILEASLTHECVHVDIDDEQLREDTVAIGKDFGVSTADLAMIMNIPKGTIAAWKAHHTMGTYG